MAIGFKITDSIIIKYSSINNSNNEVLLVTYWNLLNMDVFLKLYDKMACGKKKDFWSFKKDVILAFMVLYECNGEPIQINRRIVEQSDVSIIHDLFTLYLDNQGVDWNYKDNKHVFFRKEKVENCKYNRFELMDFDE